MHTTRALLIVFCAVSQAAAEDARPARIWNDRDLSTWAIPVAGINQTPRFFTEEEYYRIPVDNLRTYPVYLPGREPAGYQEWLKQQGPQPLIEPAKLHSEKDWFEAGRRAFEELDVPIFRTKDPKAFQYIRDREAILKEKTTVAKDGTIPGFRWVVDRKGDVQLSVQECSGCHLRVMQDGTVIRGAQGNLKGGDTALNIMLAQFGRAVGDGGKPLPIADLNYMSFGVPWIKDDVHQRFKTMSEQENQKLLNSVIPGTFARFNGSPYWITKMPDLIGVKDRRYLDHTGTHRNRGPADIARYGILVATTDDGAIGPHRFMTEHQRQAAAGAYRFSDEMWWALAKYIYSLEPPSNPNPFDAVAQRGKGIFETSGCAGCHTPPLYTNNMLIRVTGFEPPGDAASAALPVMKGISMDTDPGLALKTRKGTGYYKVPSLKGLWYRDLIEHSGSVASLEDWFDAKRLRDDYVPGGWKGPGVKSRAVKGHQFGLNLSGEDKRALVAFLRTL
jgi:hypothetical protein